MADAPEKSGPEYKDTLFLPKTDFPMRAGLPKREPDWIAHWDKIGLYEKQREVAEGREPFELHDGPPYANGNLHIGHALNKILKDVVVRSHQMLGYNSRYVPGWDCHGLPIEWKIEEKYRKKGKNKDDVPVNELRRECREFAGEWIGTQMEEFQRLGVVGDWPGHYETMSFQAEAVIAEEFLKFVMNDTLYRGSKPVMWSPIEKTALAEAEVEYHDHQSHMIWVKFAVRGTATPDAQRSGVSTGQSTLSPAKTGDLDGQGTASRDPGSSSGADDLSAAKVIIWTTTPWTIPQNRAICYSETISYGLYKITEAAPENWAATGELYLVADKLAADVFKAARVDAYEKVRAVADDELSVLTTAHPFNGAADANGEWDYPVPLLPGDHVTDEAGTGFVHTAPSHGADDYMVGVKHNLPMTHNVGPAGEFREDLPFFGGLHILDRKGKEGKANDAVIKKLSEVGGLAARGKLTHSYPHSWRSKAPLIFRNTPQWFVAMDKPINDDTEYSGKTLRTRALETIDRDVRWVPQAGRNRLYNMIEQRPDWVLSRQRAWGVPLCCFMRETSTPGEIEILKDESINAAIVAAFREEGADAWFEDNAAERFLGDRASEGWQKVTDILDVWFDSGCTHAYVLRDGGGKWPASVYLEGTDQHRGWFHSSLLEACGTRGRAPYETVVTHGFTLDAKGLKMSKSLGNQTAPQEVVKQYGADILRLWVMQTDYTVDQRIGPEILKSTADGYRRLRNTFRFMLGALDGFTEAERLPVDQMPELERSILHRLSELDGVVRKGYADFEYQKLFKTIFEFATVDLSAYYFDIRKDALYCDASDSTRRRACRTVLDILFERLTIWLAPMLCFTMEEIWLNRFPSETDSVHLQTIPDTPADWQDADLAAKWTMIRKVRRVVNGAIEPHRTAKEIGSSLEAAPTVYIVNAASRAKLEALELVKPTIGLADMCITSAITISAEAAPADAFTLDDIEGVAVVFAKANGEKCARCWKILPDVGTHKNEAVCSRCNEAVS